MAKQRIFGEITGVCEGDIFSNRNDLSQAQVHRPNQAGISGSESEGADSIVVSGGYEDDVDEGDILIYTGHGGRGSDSRQQIADQTLTRGNKALAISFVMNLPVRVVRGAHKHSKFGPTSGYRYDGLFYVTDYWREKGRSGYTIWRYKFEKVTSDEIVVNKKEISNYLVKEPESNYRATVRQKYVNNRIVRETKVAQFVKNLYEYKCQICNIQILTPIGRYAEGAHIRALGRPHNGPDTKENILCLCPNHHTMLDLGVISFRDDFSLIGCEEGNLKVDSVHCVDLDCIQYHREHHFKYDKVICK